MPTGWSRLHKYLTLRWVLRYPLFYGAIRRFRGRAETSGGPASMLEALNFLHFARWIIINKRPIRGFAAQGLPFFEESEQPEEALRDAILLFTSNFDNNWGPYVDTFMEAAVDELGIFWDNMTPEWKKPSEVGFEEFFDFVDDHVVPSDHYYAAFPSLATADMKAALFVDRHVRSFHIETERLQSDQAWHHALQLLIARLQRSLGRIDRGPTELPLPAFGLGGGGQHVALTSLAPLKIAYVERLREVIRALPTGARSPFRQVDGTHFARLVVIDKVPSAKRTVDLNSGYLLLSADADDTMGSSRKWLGRLYDILHSTPLDPQDDGGPNLVDALWGECHGFGASRTRTEFVDYIEETSFNPTVPFADYPAISLWDIHRSIATHQVFTEYAFTMPEDASDARKRFCEDVIKNLEGMDPPPIPGPAPDLKNVQANILRGTSRWQHACYVFYRIDEDHPDRARKFIDSLVEERLVLRASDDLRTEPSNVNLAFTHEGLEKLRVEMNDEERIERPHLLRGTLPRGSEGASGSTPSIDPNALRAARRIGGPEPFDPRTRGSEPPLGGADQHAPAQERNDQRSAFAAGMEAAQDRLRDEWPEWDDGQGRYVWSDGSAARAWWSDDAEKREWNPAEWPHLLVWISALDQDECHGAGNGGRRPVLARIDQIAAETGGVRKVGRQQANKLPGDIEHFGFVDGISQPAIEGIRPGWPGDGKIGARGWQPLKVGEFLLGYPDEGYGSGRLPADKEPYLRDGTFLVYRKLRQDVGAFNAAVEEIAGGSPWDEEYVAAKLMGRWRDGRPLMESPGGPHPPHDRVHRNDFTYRGDPDGSVCPFSSHVRRANPRDDLHFEGRRVNRHRIIRRGMPYGPKYEEPDEEGLGGERDDEERGLIFIAFNARIEDQFEFIQERWLNEGQAFRTGDDAELVAGISLHPNRRIVINDENPILHLQHADVTQMRGGEYFFVPSLHALGLIAKAPHPRDHGND